MPSPSVARWGPDEDRGKPPEPGYYLMRLVKGGYSNVPARIIHEDGMWRAEINGQAAGEPHPDHDTHQHVMRIWHSARRSTEQDCAYWGAVLKVLEIDPRWPIDVNQLPPIVL